ncbi:36593_t:CDS:2, partial [Racocetra persica]
ISLYGFCPNCNEPRTHYLWCQPCEAKQFRENFSNWTSGNIEIDQFIQEAQLSSTSTKSVFEWIPYSELSSLKLIKVESPPSAFDCPLSRNDHRSNKSGIDWYGISQDPETNALISVGEYAEKGILLEYLRSNCINLNWKTRINFLWQISRDLQSIIDSGFVSTALGTNSFCIKNDQIIAFRDFVCVGDKSDIDYNNNRFYAPRCQAPEYLKNFIATEESNIYSFGLIMYKFSSPYVKEVHEDSILDLTPKGAPKSYVDLMNQCLNDNPKLRPSITQIVNTLGEWYLEVERNIDTQIVTEFRIADEFRQASQMEEFNKKLKIDLDVMPLMDKDISPGSLLSIVHKLGVDLIDINQFTDRKCIKEGGFGFVEKALWRRTNKYIVLKKIKNISAINYREHKAFIHELRIHIRLDLMDRIVRMFG